MKQSAAAILLFVPLLAFGAGWSYYALNQDGEWERVSRYQLDLAIPDEGGDGEKQRVMILYNPVVAEPPGGDAKPWIRGVDAELVNEVE